MAHWKHDYLKLEREIEEFQKQHLGALYLKGNIAFLLNHHLNKAKSLLMAEVNGGLDGEYAKEVEKALRDS
jgi:hypothetical protein